MPIPSQSVLGDENPAGFFDVLCRGPRQRCPGRMHGTVQVMLLSHLIQMACYGRETAADLWFAYKMIAGSYRA